MIPVKIQPLPLKLVLNKRIAIVGIGGVGGYLGAMLAHTYPHVTLAARGKRLEHIKEHGLTLHSVYSEEITAFPEHVTTADAIGPQDYIFVCVKKLFLRGCLPPDRAFCG